MDELTIKFIRKELDHAIEVRDALSKDGLSDPCYQYYSGKADAFRLALILLDVDSKELPR